MNIYLIEQTLYDTYAFRGHVIVADNAMMARKLASEVKAGEEPPDVWMEKATITHLGPYKGSRKDNHIVLSDFYENE